MENCSFHFCHVSEANCMLREIFFFLVLFIVPLFQSTMGRKNPKSDPNLYDNDK